MTDSDFQIAAAAPTDSEGHPVHPDPDKSHRICAATKSDKTTPTDHGRERDEFDYCLLAAGWGVDGKSEGPCSHHTGAIDNRGENNPNYEHGGYSRYLSPSNFEPEEEARVENISADLADAENRDDVFRALISDLFVRWDRTHDPRFMREIRQTLSEFGYTPEEARQVHVEHSGQVDHDHSHELDDRQRAHLDAITDGPAEIDVEAVEEVDR